jgi:hypothetical protein
MKEDLQDKLVEVLSAIQGGVAQGADFVIEQLPDIAQQYIAFGRAWAFIDLASSLLLFGVGMLFFLKIGLLDKKAVDSDGGWEVTRIFSSIGGGFTSLVGFISTVMSAKNVLLVWLAPKVWLLMEIAKLINGDK